MRVFLISILALLLLVGGKVWGQCGAAVMLQSNGSNCGFNANVTLTATTDSAGFSTVGPLIYCWNTGAVSLSNVLGPVSKGVYSVTVADGVGCTASATITILSQKSPRVTADRSAVLVCDVGGTVSFSITADKELSTDTSSIVSVKRFTFQNGALTDSAFLSSQPILDDTFSFGKGTHQIVALNTAGCKDARQIEVISMKSAFFQRPVCGGDTVNSEFGFRPALGQLDTSLYDVRWERKNAAGVFVPGGELEFDGARSFAYSKKKCLPGAYRMIAEISDPKLAAMSCQTDIFEFMLDSLPAFGLGNFSDTVVCPNQQPQISGCVAGGSSPYIFTITSLDTTAPSKSAYFQGDSCFQFFGLLANKPYQLLALDGAGCRLKSDTFLIPASNCFAPNPPSLFVKSQKNPCAGQKNGALTVALVGGEPPFSVYSNGVLMGAGFDSCHVGGLGAGLCAFEAWDSKGQKAALVVQMDENAAPVFALKTTQPTCSGQKKDGQIEVEPTAGAAPFSIKWADGTSDFLKIGLAEGLFSGVLTDANGCESAFSAAILEPKNPVLLLAAAVAPTCSGLQKDGSLEVAAQFFQPMATLVWSDGGGSGSLVRKNLKPAFYELLATDAAGCQNLFSFSMADPTCCKPDFSSKISLLAPACFPKKGQAEVEITSGNAPFSITWSQNSAPNQKTIAAAGGPLEVKITDSEGCETTATGLVIDCGDAAERIVLTASVDADGAARLVWATENELSVGPFLVERSDDGQYFYAAAAPQIAGRGWQNGAASHVYEATEKAAGLWARTYRVRHARADGRVFESNAVVLAAPNASNRAATVAPNPFSGDAATLFFEKPLAEKAAVWAVDASGKTVFRGQIEAGQHALALRFEDFQAVGPLVFFVDFGDQTRPTIIRAMKTE